VSEYPLWLVAIFDVVAVSVRAGENYVPAALLPAGADLATLGRWYSPMAVTWIQAGPVPGATFWETRMRPVASAAELGELLTAWRRAVLTHPRHYLAHRAEAFLAHIGWTTPEPFYPFHEGITQNPLGLAWKPSAFATRAMAWRAGALAALPWTWFGWVYLLVSTAGLGLLAYRREANPLPAVILASGWIYLVSGLAVAVAADCRYHLWTEASTALGMLLLAAPIRRT
jgi:hypothetical protein